jgi:DNA-binding protein HU-beta
MNKTDLSAKVLELLGKEKPETTKQDSDRAVKAVLEALAFGIKKDKIVQLIGFGTFNVVQRAARTGINPSTGKPLKIKATKVLKFKVGTDLKKDVAKVK